MIAMLRSPALLLLMLGFFALAPRVAHAEATPAQDDRLKEIIAGDHRPAENKARDKYRNPYETLTFFGIRPDMTVVEIYPGQGWYTEILAPYLRAAVRFMPPSTRAIHLTRRFRSPSKPSIRP